MFQKFLHQIKSVTWTMAKNLQHHGTSCCTFRNRFTKSVPVQTNIITSQISKAHTDSQGDQTPGQS